MLFRSVRVHHVDPLRSIDAQELARGERGEPPVLEHVGADPRPLVPSDGQAVDPCTIQLAPGGVSLTLQGDDTDAPARRDGGAGAGLR